MGSEETGTGYPRYPIPLHVLPGIARDALRLHSRSFRQDAQTFLSGMDAPLHIEGAPHIPSSGPCLLVINHYSRPGFQALWIALALSAAVPVDIHWIMTSAWTFPGRWYRAALTPVTAWLFKRLALIYGFTSMPPMPPRPEDVQARAAAVRHALSYVHNTPQPVVGLAPEGRDSGDYRLCWPPSGAGRFILQLIKPGLDVIPVGAYEENGMFCLRFGPPFMVDSPAGLSPDERDRAISGLVMTRIAHQLPPALRGEFEER